MVYPGSGTWWKVMCGAVLVFAGFAMVPRPVQGSSYAIALNGVLTQCDQPSGVDCGPQ